MGSSLLTTKLYLPPARPDQVRRPRLTGRLSAALQRPLTLISAPAGFGKSTLLSQWQASPEGQGYPLAWLSLDGGDNEPSRFWAYVLLALRHVPGLAGLPETLDATAPPEILLAPLAGALEAAPGPCALVLDDFHTIESPAIHAAVSYLVEHMPAALRLVILTRSDPPCPLARLRANRQLAELRAADLRFTPEEVGEFFTHAALPAADVARLEERTEGWAAALQMVAISLEGHPDPRGFIATFSGDNRYIADYLAEEVLARQPAALRDFLLQVSILERLSAPLCAAVTGGPDSRALLEEAERKGLFLVPLDAERCWFRFHHLFCDLLSSRLQQTQPDLLPALHSRAAAWYTANGLPMDAVKHALTAREFDQAADLIEQNAGGWWALANPGLLEVMVKLPPEVIRRRPGFCTVQAWIHCILGQAGSAAALVDAAERLEPGEPEIRSFLALMRGYIAVLSGRPPAITEAVLQAPGYIPDESVAMRNSADITLAVLLYMDGQFEPAASLLLQAAERDVAGRSANALPIAIGWLAHMRLIQGRVAEAESLCRHYLAVIRDRGAARYYNNGTLNALLAQALCLQGDLARAEAEAREGVRQNEVWNVPVGITQAVQSLARVRLAQGHADEALRLLAQEEAATRGRSLPPHLVSERASLRVQAWLSLGDLAAAEHWAQASGLTAEDPLNFPHEVEHITLARVLLATGRAAEGHALLARLAVAAEAAGRLGRLAEIQRIAGKAESPLVEALSGRELEILRLLAAGHSNQEIAAALVVAVGTVKTHVHNIFGKLATENRTQAVARARELHLLK